MGDLIIGRSYTFPKDKAFGGFNNDMPVCVLRVNEAGTMIDGLTSSAFVCNVDISKSLPVLWPGPCIIQDGKTTFPGGLQAPVVAKQFPGDMLFSFDLVWFDRHNWDGLRANCAITGDKTVRIFARTQSDLDELKGRWADQLLVTIHERGLRNRHNQPITAPKEICATTPIVTQPWPFFHRRPITYQSHHAVGNPEAVAEDTLPTLDKGIRSAYDAISAVKLGELKFAPVFATEFKWPYDTNVGHACTVALYGIN